MRKNYDLVYMTYKHKKTCFVRLREPIEKATILTSLVIDKVKKI